jgi:hypothetical protein
MLGGWAAKKHHRAFRPASCSRQALPVSNRPTKTRRIEGFARLIRLAGLSTTCLAAGLSRENPATMASPEYRRFSRICPPCGVAEVAANYIIFPICKLSIKQQYSLLPPLPPLPFDRNFLRGLLIAVGPHHAKWA